MAYDLNGKRIAFITSNEGVEQAELTSPWQAVEKAGGEPVLVATKSGKVQAYNHLDKGETFDVDLTTAEARAEQFDGLVLPGGVANGDQVRGDPEAVRVVKEFFASGKPVAVICHGPWVIVEADCARGRTLTSWPTLQTDIRNAGGTWVDREVQVDTSGPNTLVSSRKPDDLEAFNEALAAAFAGQATASAPSTQR
jgi:protease I